MRISDWSSDVCSSDLENEAWLCFTDSLGEATPSELRGLFVLLTREGYPTVRIFRDAECLEAMMADFLEREDSRQLAHHALLQDLAGRMQDDSRSEARRVGKEGASTGRSRWSP